MIYFDKVIGEITEEWCKRMESVKQEAALQAKGVNLCNQLFKQEKLITELVANKWKIKHLEKEKPTLDAF